MDDIRRLMQVGSAAVLAGALVLANTATARSADADSAESPRKSIVVDVGDAQDAVEGADYRVIDRNLRSPDDTDDKVIAYSDFTPDGMGVGWVPYTGRLLQMHLGNPVIRDELPETPVSAIWNDDPIYVGDDKLVYTTENWDEALSFDRATRQWDRIPWSGLPDGLSPDKFAVGSDDRLYIAAARDGASDGVLELWSVNMNDPTDVRDEREAVGSIARSGDSLVWTDPAVKKAPYLHFRDLATGEERTVDTGTDRTCAIRVAPSGNEELVLAKSTCDDGERVTAYSVDGTSTVTVTGNDMTIGGVNDTHILVYAWPATYTVELDTGRVLKVSDRSNWRSAFLSGSYVFWHEPSEPPSVMQVVAEMK